MTAISPDTNFMDNVLYFRLRSYSKKPATPRNSKSVAGHPFPDFIFFVFR